jgi:hypothetical protein
MSVRGSTDGDRACSCEKPTAWDQSVRHDCTPKRRRAQTLPSQAQAHAIVY